MSALLPQLDTTYYVDGNNDILKLMDYYYSMAYTINQAYWSEADIDTRFKVGDQTLWNDIYGNLPAFRRRQFNFNRIRRVINMITGYQRQHRYSSVVVPVENSDQDTSDQLSKVLFWANEQGGVLDTISEAFEGAITTGMNLLSVWMDYRSDPINGEIRVDNLAYNQFLIDPYFKKRNLADCRFIWSRKWLSKTELRSIFPEREDEVDSMYARGWRDGKFQFEPEAYNYGMQDLLSFDEFWYMDYRNKKMLVDTETGASLEWKGDDENLELYKYRFPNITTVDYQQPTVKLALVVNGRPFYNGINPMGIDRFPHVPVLAYYEPQVPYFPWRCTGVVRGLRDAQYLYNRKRIIECDMLESVVLTGVKYKEDSLINPKDAFLTGPGRSFGIKKEASMDDVQQLVPPQVPPSFFQLSELLGREIQEISGVNEELLGSAIDDKAGILSMLRQGAGLTTLQILFDQLNYAQKELGKIFIDLIQENFTPGKIKRIINEEPTDQFYTRAFQKFDCTVEEGLYTSTQKQLNFAQLLNLREVGIPVPTGVLIECSTLQNKKQLTEAIENEEKRQQEQQEKAEQVQIELLKAQIEDLQAKSVANTGLGAERFARIEENKALAIERLAEAEKDRSLGVLHELQAMKELEEMDLNQAKGLLEIIERMKMQSEMKEEARKDEITTNKGMSALNAA